jgi:hypothetical protein
MRMVSLRALLLIGFVIAMPVLALPPVAQRVDELLYGPPPDDFGQPGEAPPLQDPIPLAAAQHVAPLGHLEQGPAAEYLAAAYPPRPQGLDAVGVGSPVLAPTPAFAPEATVPAHNTSEPAVTESTIARLHEIRQRLEQLGAEYVVVETTGGGSYRFHCRMLVDARSRFTRPFEATLGDPLAAGEEVLRAVEAWRGQR